MPLHHQGPSAHSAHALHTFVTDPITSKAMDSRTLGLPARVMKSGISNVNFLLAGKFRTFAPLYPSPDASRLRLRFFLMMIRSRKQSTVNTTSASPPHPATAHVVPRFPSGPREPPRSARASSLAHSPEHHSPIRPFAIPTHLHPQPETYLPRRFVSRRVSDSLSALCLCIATHSVRPRCQRATRKATIIINPTDRTPSHTTRNRTHRAQARNR